MNYSVVMSHDSINESDTYIEFEQDQGDSETGMVFVRLSQGNGVTCGTFSVEVLETLLDRCAKPSF
jgi:hypothetical protein